MLMYLKFRAYYWLHRRTDIDITLEFRNQFYEM